MIRIVTPDGGLVYEEDTDRITLPSQEGMMEALRGHMEIGIALKPGIITVGQDKQTFAIKGGVAWLVKNNWDIAVEMEDANDE